MNALNAARLQQVALRVAAAQEGIGLNLAETVKYDLPLEELHSGDRVVVIGLVDHSILTNVARQIGPTGSVWVIESEADYLERSRQRMSMFQEQVGYANWRLEQGALDDLRTDSAFVTRFLAQAPIATLAGYQTLQDALATQRSEAPLVADGSADVVVLDAAVNRLPRPRIKTLLAEAFRVLRRGGRLMLALVLADEPAAVEWLALSNGLLLSCVPLEKEIVDLLDEAGYHGMEYARQGTLPLMVAGGVELHAFVVTAYKGKQGPCLDAGHAVIYRGPWREVHDDDGHRYVRGERVAVCDKTYGVLNRAPYQGEFICIPCYLELPADQRPYFDCNTPRLRDPQVTKGKKTVLDASASSASGCSPANGGGKCC